MNEQLAFSLESPPLFLEETYYLCASNQEAYDTVMSWPDWPAGRVVYLCGEKGAGKSHLAALWQERSWAHYISHKNLSKDFVLEKEHKENHFILEDVENVTDEVALFHLLNLMKETQGALLITSSKVPRDLPFSLPDLMSRLKGVSLVRFEPPDDDFIRALLIKRFSDLQLKIGAASLDYILKHLTRSYEALDHFIRCVDKLSWQEKRPLTIPFLRQVFSLLKEAIF